MVKLVMAVMQWHPCMNRTMARDGSDNGQSSRPKEVYGQTFDQGLFTEFGAVRSPFSISRNFQKVMVAATVSERLEAIMHGGFDGCFSDFRSKVETLSKDGRRSSRLLLEA